MAERKTANSKARAKHQGAPKHLPVSPSSPIVLVPETPCTPGEIPIATEDEATPTPAAPPSPSSYAQVAAMPAARANVVVWPRNTAAAPLAPRTPPSGQLSPKSELSIGDAQNVAHTTETSDGAGHNADLEDNTSTSISSFPSSSPIRFTASASATPVPMEAASTAPGPAHALGPVAGQGSNTYEDFWAQVRTPTLSETNMPSALQTPRILTPQPNQNHVEILWPTTAPANAAYSNTSTSNIENQPPSSHDVDSHPPVASRLRKRRRGLSPALGERMSKSARRKGKARAKEPAAHRRTDCPEAGHENPWASSGRSREAADAETNTPLPLFLPTQSPSSMNVTPYDHFARASSATTSFIGRFNESGSFPTPHRVSNSPAPPSDAASPSYAATRQPSTLPSSSIPPTDSRRNSLASARSTMDIDAISENDRDRLNPQISLDGRRTTRGVSLSVSQMQDEALSREARRRLRDVLSDPDSMDGCTNGYRSPTMEDVPEEGEVPGSRSSSTTRNGRGWVSDASRWHDGHTLPPMEGTPWRTQGSMSRYDDERDSQTPGSAFRDEFPSRWSSVRHQSPRRVSPQQHAQPEQRPNYQLSRAATLPPANRISGLDAFDVGQDDNLPDAVRRGGAAHEDEVEHPTPIPFEGDPEVHRHDPEAHLRGSLGRPNEYQYHPEYLQSAVHEELWCEQEDSIGSPEAPEYRGRGPVEWAITGLSSEGVECLLRRRVWSFKSITFFPRRRSLENPRWILALEGFLEDNVSNIEAAVRSTFERPQIRQRIVQMIRANPEFNSIPTEEALRRIMSTLRVSVYTLDNETVVANVFLRSPTQSIRVWRRWIQELRELTFGSHHTAIAKVRRISACAGCLGVDHPTHLCPFTRLPNWNGPETAGGSSYSVDGRERRGGQQPDATRGSTDSLSQGRSHSQHYYRSGPAQAGPSRSRSAAADGGWGYYGQVRGRDESRESGQGRGFDQGRRGSSRRGRKDGAAASRNFRESYRKDERR
ncbi:hypothetical protein K466DRAFT_627754 [Polyporus arcularius HHB13444]|uniref:Uncharacterized protein n=1 Tax=Polyporus arcularius HHB13444 TaxID=1314778 RepID=A0A5C3PQV2_9APHY|nr:hypothetical protein K466DRAFT_627754 [Polyporus arcularius HHB13444]